MPFDYQSFSCIPVCGSTHRRNNLPCEDACRTHQGSRYHLLVASDGHGSGNSCRARYGSEFAVQSAIETVSNTLDKLAEEGHLDNLGSDGDDGEEAASLLADNIEHMKMRLLARWDEKVCEHLEAFPFNPLAEYKMPDEQTVGMYLAGKRLKRMYGATLELAVVGDGFWFGLQIGDGALAVRDADGWSIPIADDDLKGEKTYSLCNTDAIAHMKSFLHIGPSPLAVFVHTDGISKAYGTYEPQFRLYDNIVARCHSFGVGPVMDGIGDDLYRISLHGSGDDISFAAVMDMTADWSSLTAESLMRVKEAAKQHAAVEAETKDGNADESNISSDLPGPIDGPSVERSSLAKDEAAQSENVDLSPGGLPLGEEEAGAAEGPRAENEADVVVAEAMATSE